MTNQRGWKGGVYNPGFPPDKAYMERKAKEFAAAGFEWPEIKGVQFKRTKNQHKPLRNVVTRVVMVGFDPFNHSGLPEHIERQVVHDYWSGLEMQFVQDWVNEAPEGEIRFGGLLNLYGDETSYKSFPEPACALDLPDEDELRTHIANTFGLPEHLMKPTLRIPSFANEVSYNGVKLSQIEIPESLNKTRDLVIELTKEVSLEDQPNLLTLFVARGGNIRDLSDFFMIVKDAAPAPIRREPPVRTREDERGHEQYLRDSVRGIFPLMVLEQTAPDMSDIHSTNPIIGRGTQLKRPMTDRDHTKLAVKPTPEQREELEKATDMVTVFDNGEFIPQAKAYYTDAQGNKKDLRSLDLMGLLLGISPEPEPIEGEVIEGDLERELQKTGLYRPEGGIDVFKVAALAKRNTTVEGELVDKGVEVRVIPDDELPPEPTEPAPVLSGRMSMRRPNPLREHWEKHGDPYEGRIPHIAEFSELAKLTSQSGRNETMAIHIEPTLTPEEIADREQAIQEASEGKLDYLLEGTQWDPKNRKN